MQADDELPDITVELSTVKGGSMSFVINLDGMSVLTFFGLPAQIDRVRAQLLRSLAETGPLFDQDHASA